MKKSTQPTIANSLHFSAFFAGQVITDQIVASEFISNKMLIIKDEKLV